MKAGSKLKSKPAEKKKPPPPPEPVDIPSSGDEEGWEEGDSGDESESDEEDDGVDEAGFEKLIKVLGDDPLNEYDQAHLVALAGGEGEDEGVEGEDFEEDEDDGCSGSEVDEEISEEGEEAGEGGSDSGPEDAGIKEGESSAYEDVLALDELEDVELHPDAIPRRGIKVVDNRVRAI